MDIKGLTVEKVLVTSKIDIKEEYYLGIILDRKSQAPVVMVSKEGGIDIEEVAANTPEKIIQAAHRYALGFAPLRGTRYPGSRRSSPSMSSPKAALSLPPWRKPLLRAMPALPKLILLYSLKMDKVQAADAKILIDDNGLFRQKEYATWAETEESNPLEYEAKQAGLTYVKLDGDVGIIGNGAGLVMTTLDMVARAGGKPANFLDIGGGAKAEVMYKALTFVARDPQVKGILVNIFGGITRGEEVAKGVIMAQAELPKGMPIVVRLSGTGAEEGKALLKDAGLDWGKDMREAAQKIVAAIMA